MEDDKELLNEIAKIFKDEGVEVNFMQSPTDLDKEGKTLTAVSLRCSEDFKKEIQSMIINQNIEVAYLYKAGWIEYPDIQLPYFRIGKLIKN